MTSTDTRAPRVCLVTQWFPPEPAFVAQGLAEALVREGWEVEVLTAHPNYPTGVVYPGFGPAWRRKRGTTTGLQVTRTPVFPSHDKSAARRMLNYLTWAAGASLFGLAPLRRADVALVYASPATAALPAVFARRLFGTPMVLMVQDLWPDSVISSGFLSPRSTGVVTSVLGLLTSATYERAAHVVAISPGMLQVLRDRGVPENRSTLVYNWALNTPSGDTQARLRVAIGVPKDAFVLMYAGNHGPAQALEVLIEGVMRVPKDRDCHLVLVGDGVSKGMLMEQAGASERIHFLPSMTQEELLNCMPEADVQCVSLSEDPAFDITMPSKIQGILAMGLPLLTVARGDAAAVTVQSGSGIAVEPGDVAGVAGAIDRLIHDRSFLPKMGHAARSYYEREMSSRVGGRRLDAVLRSVIGRGSAANSKMDRKDDSE